MALILQSGGYLKGVNNRKVTVIDYELTKRKLVAAAKAVKCPYTLRTIARVNRDTIALVAEKFNAPGNLYSQYKVHNPNILKADPKMQLEHAIYCTDFQRENPNIPQEVLSFLSTREVKRKEKK